MGGMGKQMMGGNRLEIKEKSEERNEEGGCVAA